MIIIGLIIVVLPLVFTLWIKLSEVDISIYD